MDFTNVALCFGHRMSSVVPNALSLRILHTDFGVAPAHLSARLSGDPGRLDTLRLRSFCVHLRIRLVMTFFDYLQIFIAAILLCVIAD